MAKKTEPQRYNLSRTLTSSDKSKTHSYITFKQVDGIYTIFQLGKATLLRVSDVLSLEYSDVFTTDGVLKERAYITDQKTGKPNTLYLKPLTSDLMLYHEWLIDSGMMSSLAFFPLQLTRGNISRESKYYKIMTKVGDLLGINYLGTHTMRKTGAYRVYEQTNYNIGFVMNLLNHSDQKATLAYLGLDAVTRESLT
jgi:integrase